VLQREEKDWGVKLTLEPFGESEAMKLVGEIDLPKGEKPPATRFWLDATPSKKPLRMTDLHVIQQGLHQFIDAVKDETAKMTNPQRSRKPKKKG
jgi:hypothetical protein